MFDENNYAGLEDELIEYLEQQEQNTDGTYLLNLVQYSKWKKAIGIAKQLVSNPKKLNIEQISPAILHGMFGFEHPYPHFYDEDLALFQELVSLVDVVLIEPTKTGIYFDFNVNNLYLK
jgi:hypothetical protein